MGFWSGAGKVVGGVGKSAFSIGSGVASVTGGASMRLGEGMINRVMNNPGRAISLVGGAALAGYALSDADHNSNPTGGAKKLAFGATALMAAPVIGNVAMAAGGVAGMGALGAGIGIAGGASAVSKAVIKQPTTNISIDNIKDMKFTPLGKAVFGVGAIAEGGKRAYDTFKQGRTGRHDGMVHTQTPTIPTYQQGSSYSNNGGATGDLVFSLYNNR